MEEKLEILFNEFNKNNSNSYINLYDFILRNSRIKIEKSDITETELRKLPNIKLYELVSEIYDVCIKALEKNSKSESILSLKLISEIGKEIFSNEEFRKLYDDNEACRAIFTPNDIISMKQHDLKKYQNYVDKTSKEEVKKAKKITKEDLIKFLKHAKKEYSDELRPIEKELEKIEASENTISKK